MAELCTAIVSVAIVAAAFRQLTFGVMSLRPALAHEVAQRLAAALGRSLRSGDSGLSAVRDHWIARLLDVVDLLRMAWSKLR